MRLSRWWGVAVGAVAGATLAVLVLERCREAPRPEQPTSTGPGDGKAEPEREATDSDTQPEWDIDLLKTIYQADRAQQSSDLAVALALVGAFIAYVSATLAFSKDLFENGRFSHIHWALLFVPLPAWIMAAYHSLLGTASPVRSRSIKAIETILKDRAGFTRAEAGKARFIGNEGAEKVINIDEAKWAHKTASFITYGGVLPLIVGYTAYFVGRAPAIPLWGRLIAAVAYGVLGVLIINSWIAGFRSYREAEEALGLRGP